MNLMAESAPGPALPAPHHQHHPGAPDPLSPTGEISHGGEPREERQPPASRRSLRYSRALQIPAGMEWPSCDPNGAVPPKRFRWLLVENRGVYASGTDAYVSLTDRPVVADQTSWYMCVPAGTKRVRCVAGARDVEATPLRLRILNAGAAAIVVWLEVDNEYIEDKLEKLSP
jgi:hypothetical protein